MTKSPALRLAFGVVSLTGCALLLSDVFFGVSTDTSATERQHRNTLAEVATSGIAQQLSTSDYRVLEQSLDAVRAQAPDILKIEVRNPAGELIAVSGAVPPTTQPAPAAADHLRVNIQSGQTPWGQAEFIFTPAPERATVISLPYGQLWWLVALGAASVLLAYLYLRRALLYLDPMSVVPDRLRTAFDSLTEGLALLDPRHRVVMGNKALREMTSLGPNDLLGRKLEDVAQLVIDGDNTETPWHSVIASGQAVRGVRVRFGNGNDPRTGSLNCAPIVDALGTVRGCLVTLSDVSAVERSNEQLRAALAEIGSAQALIEKQNVELRRLALHDGLTGLLNRRAFFQNAGEAVARQAIARAPVAVLMLDVDHFKSFNDRYGHATGDLVLQRVARCLESTVRVNDIAARYGGEEFCILAEGLDTTAAMALAERVRYAIETEAGVSTEAGEPLTVTTSVGVAVCLQPTGNELSAMVKAADAALYVSKRNGRNRVTLADAQDQQLSRKRDAEAAGAQSVQ